MKVKAKESPHVLKARQKLKQQIENEGKQLTGHALEKIRKTMRHWIERHAPERVDLKAKLVTLFDENRHSAKVENRFILKKLKDLKSRPSSKLTLTGRIKHNI